VVGPGYDIARPDGGLVLHGEHAYATFFGWGCGHASVCYGLLCVHSYHGGVVVDYSGLGRYLERLEKEVGAG